MLESPKKTGKGVSIPWPFVCDYPSFFNIMLKRRLLMMVLSRMMTHFANAVGLEKASKGFPGSLRRKKLSLIEMLDGFSIPLPIRYICISSVHIMITLPPAPSPPPPAILRSGRPDFDSHQQEENLSILKRDKRSISSHSVTYFHYSVNYCEKGSF